MAEAVLALVLENLSSLIQNELALLLGFDQDMRHLSSTLTAIKATLEDAEEEQFSNRAIKDWLHKLKDAAHILDDILDECATHALEFQYHEQAHKVQQSSCLSSFHPKHVVFRYKIGKKMKRIRDRLDEIAEERNMFFKRLTIHGECSQDLLSSIHKSCSLEYFTVVGNEELSYFPDGKLRDLTSLKTLQIASCGKFKFSGGFQYLTSLERLHIEDCPEVEDLPEALQHMTSLQSLTLDGRRNRNLRSLPHWLGNLTLLCSLYIHDCPKLMCLPMSIQCLSALENLSIWRCPELEKRCKK